MGLTLTSPSLLFAKNKNSSFNEKLNLKLIVNGDFKAEYNFSGSPGSQIKGVNTREASPCEISSLFRIVSFKQKKSLEAWLYFECVFEGQKSNYRAHPIYLSLGPVEQIINLPVMGKNLKNVQLSFQEVSLKSSK